MPCRPGPMPVSTATREGEQIGEATYPLVNRVPAAASRSMFGVIGFPVHPSPDFPGTRNPPPAVVHEDEQHVRTGLLRLRTRKSQNTRGDDKKMDRKPHTTLRFSLFLARINYAALDRAHPVAAPRESQRRHSRCPEPPSLARESP